MPARLVFVAETKHDKEMEPRTELFITVKRLKEQGYKSKNLSMVPVPVKVFSASWKFIMVEEH
jgi:hypothetical protein